jgi:predicted RNA binding protein YcfA (HicA-like mRNA interferase family)
MSRRDRLRRDLLAGQIPIQARISDVQALYEDAGWMLDRISGSHFQFTKPGKRTEVVAVHKEQVRVEPLRNLAKALREATEAD